MKIVSSLLGVSAFRGHWDDMSPINGVVWGDLVKKISETYKFTSVPTVPTGSGPTIQVVFQAGEFESDGAKISIHSLFLTNRGAAIQSLTTQHSDLVLESLISLLDESFGFRIRASDFKRDHASNVVVQFDKSVENVVEAIARIGDLVRERLSLPKDQPYSLKRLAFGKEPVVAAENAQVLAGLEAVDYMDFTIERRANASFSENRYFAGAPMSTESLFRTLEAIEQLIGEREPAPSSNGKVKLNTLLKASPKQK